MERSLRDKKAICFFVIPALLWFAAIALVPIFQSTYYSFLKWDGITASKFIGLENYINLFQDQLFLKSIVNSLILAASSVFIQLPVSMVLALVLASGIKGENAYRTIYFIPVIISSTIIAQLWMKVYHPTYGLLNSVLGMFGLDQFKSAWLANSSTALAAVFIPMIWQYVGYHMLLFYSAAKSIVPEIFEAARVDGANDRQIALKIIIPQIVPMIKACVIFAVIGSLKSFDLIYVLTRGGPLHSTEVPTMLMYTEIFSKNQYGYASGIAIFIIIECLVLTLIIQQIFKKRQEA
ncbi:carbohydrate ABC transporter permease [Ruminiclostridium cellobioparum]|uniref:ABC transporter, permease protein n=1 Tax=Ruminiclostridium cellobioparum subsp. termitidis CT1112 TaxID=1195236 RepID=S0FG82_RUMCE|nr:sugar ABC transporter permease [Ruminiclostridium cellobioparum]EMS69922.1 ABC transporter, permease protein [Ruminiclostridium cellobioparum subsp. termitidis CT1112]